MDSLTQITLGAAAGELALGRMVGNKAIFWGAVAGTIPDLDVVFSPFLNDIEKLVYHRGFSHALKAQGLDYSAYMTLPTPINIVLWNCIAQDEKGFWQGNYSLFDNDKNVRFRYTPKNHHLLAAINKTWEIEQFRRVSGGYFTVEERDG